MEVFFLATGEKSKMEYFEKEMQFQKFILPYVKDGKTHKAEVYGNLNEMKFFRFIFPKEYQNEVIESLNLETPAYNKRFTPHAFVLRKALKLKKIKKKGKAIRTRNFGFRDIALIPVGMKEDNVQTFPNGCTHEGL